MYCLIALNIEGNDYKIENLKRAIRAYKEIFKVITFECSQMQYAMTKNNIGNSYAILSKFENKRINLKKAIVSYLKALKVRKLENLPIDYARTMQNLGSAFGDLAEVENREENCKKVKCAFNEAMKIYVRENLQYNIQDLLNNTEKTKKICGDFFD